MLLSDFLKAVERGLVEAGAVEFTVSTPHVAHDVRSITTIAEDDPNGVIVAVLRGDGSADVVSVREAVEHLVLSRRQAEAVGRALGGRS